VCVPSFDLKEIGPGFPLYYGFTKYLLGLLVFFILLLAVPFITSNIIADHFDDWDAESSNVLIRMSLGNHGDPDDRSNVFPMWQSILNIVAMILMYISYYLLRAKQSKDVKDIDDAIVTPGDYTILVKGLPSIFTEEEVKDLFNNHGRKDGVPVFVEKVNIPYKIKDFVEDSKRHERLKNLQFDKVEYEKAHPGHVFYHRTFLCFKAPSQPVVEIEKECNAIEERLLNFIDRAESGDVTLLVGQAFVTFRRQESADAVVAFWGGSSIERFWSNIFSICKKQVSVVQGSKINSKKLIVEAAPEPNDIIWDNIGTTFWEKTTARIRTYVFCFLCLCASFAMIFFASVYQESIQDDYDNKPEEDRSTSDMVKLRFLSILPSIGVVVVNMCLERIIRGLTFFEKHETLTQYNTSVAVKLTTAQVINTALIAFIVNLDPDKSWFVPGGLVEDMSWILISNAIVQPFLKLFSVQHVVKWIKRKRALKNPLLTQSEANDIFEEPPVDMAKLYACLMKTLIVTLVYVPILPFGLIVSSVGVVLMYWTDKYMLLRRHARPNRMSSELSQVMTSTLPLAIFLYSLTNYYFILVLNPDDSLPAFIWMLICAGMILLPIETAFRIIRGRPAYKDSPETVKNKDYEDEAGYFIDDYDRQNPVTTDAGWDWYNQLVVRKNVDRPDDLKDAIAQQPTDTKARIRGNLAKYMEVRQAQDDEHAADYDNQGILEIAGHAAEIDNAKKRQTKAKAKMLAGYGNPSQRRGADSKMKKLKQKRKTGVSSPGVDTSRQLMS